MSRKGKYQSKPLDLNQLVNETADTIGKTKKEIIIHCDLSEDLYGIKADQASDILKRGCDDFIQKPFSLEELSGKIMKVMAQK